MLSGGFVKGADLGVGPKAIQTSRQLKASRKARAAGADAPGPPGGAGDHARTSFGGRGQALALGTALEASAWPRPADRFPLLRGGAFFG